MKNVINCLSKFMMQIHLTVLADFRVVFLKIYLANLIYTNLSQKKYLYSTYILTLALTNIFNLTFELKYKNSKRLLLILKNT